ncbi:MAG TPA: DinB family protein [Bacteroidia bacterium]|nr:DinB family protein [Bacteroidia bacterium]HNT80008.1 DinB family protein [Bacteroidia bacterium]
MEFSLEKSLQILERTPNVLEHLLSGIHMDWIENNEGPDTWSPFDIVGHLLHGEVTDWIPRLEKVLLDEGDKVFVKFNREAMFQESKGKDMQQLLLEFKQARSKNLALLHSKNLKANDFSKTAEHPALGMVTLRQLIATWTVHDLTHTNQICRVMAKQYQFQIGPWLQYINLLNKKS